MEEFIMYTLITTGAIALPVVFLVLLCAAVKMTDKRRSTQYGVGALVVFILTVYCAAVFYDHADSGVGMTLWYVIFGFVGGIAGCVVTSENQKQEGTRTH